MALKNDGNPTYVRVVLCTRVRNRAYLAYDLPIICGCACTTEVFNLLFEFQFDLRAAVHVISAKIVIPSENTSYTQSTAYDLHTQTRKLIAKQCILFHFFFY